MKPISIFLSTTVRILTVSSTALLLSLISMSGASADVATVYNNSCAACHDSGALNAIKKGDSAQWQQLKKQKGMPTLINSVKKGMIQMPAGGLCKKVSDDDKSKSVKCSDEDYRKLIEYMSQ